MIGAKFSEGQVTKKGKIDTMVDMTEKAPGTSPNLLVDFGCATPDAISCPESPILQCSKLESGVPGAPSAAASRRKKSNEHGKGSGAAETEVVEKEKADKK